MADFDMDAYLRRRPFNPNATDKLAGLEEATQSKIKALQQYSQERQAIKEANKNSWVNQLGLGADSAGGQAVNLAASFASGAARVGGQIAALPANAVAMADELSLDAQDHDAYNRYVKGVATPEDMVRLSSKKAMASKNDRPEDIARAQELANKSPDAPTVLQLFDRAQNARETGQDVAKRFNLESIVNTGKRQALTKQLEGNFEGNWDQAKQGWASMQKGEDGKGMADIAAGIGKLIYNAGEAAVSNPAAASEYIVENLPQLGLGLFGAAGKASLTASNVGYGADLYQQGIEKYRKDNGGQLPSVEERQHMAMNAAGAILAEQGGDLASLALMKAAGKAGTDAVRTGFKESLKNTLKATTGGIASEAATEGYQTYAEGEATLKPASAKDIYTGATIGGIAGGGLSGGGRAVAELAQATPEHAQKRADEAQQQQDHLKAIQTNDTSAYLDPKTPSYDPVKAAQVLFGHAQLDTTSEETKQANLTQASQIVSELESRKAKAQAAYDSLSPETLAQMKQSLAAETDPEQAKLLQAEITDIESNGKRAKQLETQISSLDRQIDGVRKVKDGLIQMVQPTNLDAQVTAANVSVDPQDQDSLASARQSADSVINLSMAHPNALSAEKASELASNMSNSLSQDQRSYLRAFSEARAAENKLKNMGRVGKEILEGDPAKNQLGIAQYRSRVTEALQAGNQKEADRNLALLAKFVANQTGKARMAIHALQEAKKTGRVIQIVPTKQGWEVATQVYSQDDLRKAEGLGMWPDGRSNGLVGNIQGGAKALRQAQAELNAAYTLRFAQTSVKKPDVTEGVNSSQPSQAQETAPQKTADDGPATPQSTEGQTQSNVDSTVDHPKNPSTSRPVLNSKSVFRSVKEAWAAQEGSLKEAEDAIRAGRKTEQEAAQIKAEREALLATPNRSLEEDLRIRELDDLYMLLAIKNDPVNELQESILTWEDEKKDLEKYPEDVGQEYAAARIQALDALLTDAREFARRAENLVNGKQSQDPKSTSKQLPVPENVGDQQSTESTADDSQSAEDGKLANFGKPIDESKAYNEQDLIARYFAQSAGADTGTQRPLVKVKNFLSKLSEGLVSINDFLLNKEASSGDRQIAAFAKFREQAAHWFPMIEKNLISGNKRKDDPKFYFQDLMQFLIQRDGSKPDLEENVKTALSVAAFSWVAENATRPAANSDEEINRILGRDEDALVSERERDALAYVGTRENVVINSLGQRAVQALGLKPTQDAPLDLLPRLESALGAHVMKLLMDDGILFRETVSGTKMKALTGSQDTKETANFKFLSLARDDQRNLSSKAEAIYQANKGSQGFLDKLFSVESAAKEPSFEPIPFNQKTTRNTQQQVPERLAKIVEEKNAEANYVRQDMWHLMGQLDESVALAMAGVASVSEKDVHKSKRSSIQAKNDGLIREFRNFMDFVGSTVFPSEKGLEQPLYFEHSVWKQQRVGIATNMINPQSSKIHRFMLFRKSWDTTVSMNDLDSFKLRVLEGLGVKTDKQANGKSLDQYEAKVGDLKIQAAVAVLQKQIYDGTESLSAADQATLLAGVKAGGEKFHSLDALMALAYYEQAKATGKDSFTVQMMGEVDGVTNGPMLSHLLLGAASSAKALFGLLNKGGFYQEGSGNENYNVWRGQPGQLDLYETTTRNVLDNVRRMVKSKGKDAVDPGLLASVYTFTGQLENEETREVLKAGRNIIKTPLTAMVFGSAIPAAIDSMADKFVESVYDAIEATAKENTKALSQKDLILNLRRLGVSVSVQDNLLELEFSESEIHTLKNAFKNTLGKAVEATIKQDFAIFMEQRKSLNEAAGLSFALYDAVYQGYRQQFLVEMVQRTKDGRTDGIALNGAGRPIRDLTRAEERELQKKVAAVLPIMQTLMAKDSNNLKAGLLMAKTDRKLSDQAMYSNTVQFGSPFADNQAFSVSTHGYEVGQAAPGVAIAPMSIHSTDSAISHYAAEGNEVLNVHDAHGSGLGNFTRTARNLNQATWNAMLNYSPASEMFAALERTVLGLDAVLQRSDVPDLVKQNLADAINKLAVKQNVSGDGFITSMVINSKFAAAQADKIKLEALAQMSSVDQYALEGGNYAVTVEDRAAAQAKLAEVNSSLAADTKAAVERIEQALESRLIKSEKTAPVVNPGDPLWQNPALVQGKAQVASDPAIVELFEKNPKTTAGAVMDALMESGQLSPINQKILSLLNKLVDPNMKVEMLTATSDLSEVDVPTDASLGWIVRGTEKNPKGAIFVLGPEFKFSGLTPEVLLHELVHAAFVDVVSKAGDPKTEVGKALAELESLRQKAQEFANGKGLTQWNTSLASMDEFIAYGMTSQKFQAEVLTQITMKSQTTGNKLVTGMQKFISSLTSLLFKKPNERLDNGLTLLVQNVSALAYQAGMDKKNTGGSVMLSMAAQIRDMTTIDIFESLNGNGSAFADKMRGLLDGIVSKLHGPFGSLKADRMAQTVLSPTDLWIDALASGEAPFASKALASGFRFTDQEAFVLEQVEATVQAALTGETSQTTFAYSELAKLYQEVRSKISAQDFVTVGIAPTIQQAQALYDFIFKMEKSIGDRSDYLARFAAVGLAHEGFNKVLDMATERSTPGNAAKGFIARLDALFHHIMDWLVGKVTYTFAGQQANEKLTHLVDQLVGIEAKKRAQLLSQESNLLEPLETKGKEITEYIRTKVGDFGRSAVFKQTKNGFVNATGALISTIAQDRLDYLMEGFNRLRDKHFRERHGVLAGLINEIRGANDHNKVFHSLLRETKRHEGERKREINTAAKLVLESFANQGKDLTEDQKKTISYVFLRTDMVSLLDTHGLSGIAQFLNSNASLQREIRNLEGQLTQYPAFRHYFTKQAKITAHYMVSNKAAGTHLILNAGNIARLHDTPYMGRMSEQDAQAVEAILEQLITLRAIEYTSKEQRDGAKDILYREMNRTDGNGVELVLKLHRELQKQSKERLFEDGSALMTKGYTPEIYNPYREIKVANLQEGAKLEKMGYVRGAAVSLDPLEKNTAEVQHLYLLRDGGLRSHTTGTLSYTGMRAKGSRARTDGVTDIDEWRANQDDLTAMHRAKQNAMKRLFAADPDFDPREVKDNFAVPVLNAQGQSVDYRYLMQAETKDVLLERDNRFDKILGTLAGSIYDKETSAEQNRKVVEALHQQYEQEFAQRSESYVRIGPDSGDAEYREIWKLLPESTKQAVREIWGSEGMLVRVDLLDINFGYRKLSISDAFDKDAIQRSIAEKFFVDLAEHIGGKRAKLWVRQAEDVWQEIVKETKDILVVKTGITLMGNVMSNLSELLWFGVSPKAILEHHRVALKGASDYRRDRDALGALKLKLGSGYSHGNRAEMEREVIRLEDAIARNPVRELIEAGLMPSIVEDVAADDALYSYKSRFVRKTEGYAEKLNPSIQAAARNIYMAKDTKVYQALSYGTQVSDFVARYTLYQHLTTRKKNPMDRESAIQLASDAFVNYDIPSHRTVQYLNDMGAVWFTKYYLRIQKVIATLYRDQPGRALAILALGEYFDTVPLLTDSQFIHRLNNPFSIGALKFPNTLDDLATVKLGMSAF